jgi:hypothetical protein
MNREKRIKPGRVKTKKPANVRRCWLSIFQLICVNQYLRRGRDYLASLGDPLGGGVKTKEVLGAIAPLHFPLVRFGKLAR